MAKLAFLAPLIFAGVAGAVPAWAKDVSEADALEAYKNYWQHFDSYEQKILQEQMSKNQNSAEALKSKKENLSKEQASAEAAQLAQTAERYRKHVKNHPDAENLPYVLLNIAQVLNQLADHYRQSGDSKESETREEARSWLRRVEKDFPAFAKKEEALYIAGFIYKDSGQEELAMERWSSLAHIKSKSIYVVHANIAVGDYHFRQEKGSEAARYYANGLKILEQADIPKKDLEHTRLQYRLMWAAYRAADLKTAVSAATMVLTPGRSQADRNQLAKMQEDAVDVLANALYEHDSVAQSRKTLSTKEISATSCKVTQKLLQNYRGASAFSKMAAIGESTLKGNPACREAPLILAMLSDAYNELNEEEKRLSALERLALLLPAQSLWRTRFHDDYDATSKMETQAIAAAETLAAFYYARGMNTSQRSQFALALPYFDLLLTHKPAGDEANFIRLKAAHAAYFAEKWEEAEKRYQAMLSDQKLKTEVMRAASYHLVLTRERQWRDAFSDALSKKSEPAQDPVAVERLRKLETSVEEYANKFPSDGTPATSRGVDLLLVAAAASRDHDNYPQASKFWQRALISHPSDSQRAIAMRGLLLAAMKSGKSEEVINTSEKFLASDTERKIDPALAAEIKGVLSGALRARSEELNDGGFVQEAGTLLVDATKRHEDIPERDKLYRDGAYLLAIAGEWQGARQAASEYTKKSDGSRYAADMMYLEARAEEFQLRFKESAATYLALAERHPKHSKAASSLERAERLASAEGDLMTAGKAASLIGERSEDSEQKLAAYSRAVQHYDAAGKPNLAREAAAKRLAVSKNAADRMRSELMLANTQYATRQEDKALAAYAHLATSAEKSKSKIDPVTYKDVTGEANFRLGEEKRAAFDDFTLAERRGSLSNLLSLKLKMFEDLSHYYDKAASTNHPEWSPRSRYQLAEAAEQFSHELATLPKNSHIEIPAAMSTRLQQASVKLQNIARRALSTNAMLATSDRSYQNNIWVKKSRVKLTGTPGTTPPATDEPLPAAVGTSMTSPWSL